MSENDKPQVVAVYSEAGGAGKTITSVSLAMVGAESGKRVVLVDLDPRGATTKWLDVAPAGDGLDMSAILGNPDVTGWAEGMAVPTTFHENLRAIPSHRTLATFEHDTSDAATTRLRDALVDIEADLVVIDCPNRQGGALTLNALVAADTVVYAATPSADGVDGYLGAEESVQAFKARTGSSTPVEVGIIVTGVKDTVISRNESHSLNELRNSGNMLTPAVPHRTIVGEVRYSHEWFGKYRKSFPVLDAYRTLAQKVIR